MIGGNGLADIFGIVLGQFVGRLPHHLGLERPEGENDPVSCHNIRTHSRIPHGDGFGVKEGILGQFQDTFADYLRSFLGIIELEINPDRKERFTFQFHRCPRGCHSETRGEFVRVPG